MTTDLFAGKSVVVTRASHQSGDLISALRCEGADVVPAPAIAIVPPMDGGQPLDDALLRLERFSWIAFQSELFEIMKPLASQHVQATATVIDPYRAAPILQGITPECSDRKLSGICVLIGFP